MSDRVFNWLLRLYPRSFRAEYGEQMRQLFRDQLRDAPGLLGRARVWALALADILVSAPREYHRPPRETAGAYRLTETGIRAILRNGHAQGIPYALLCIAAGFFVSWYGDAPRLAVFTVFGLALLMLLPALHGLARFRRHWRGFSLNLGPDVIEELSAGAVVKSVRRTDAIQIIEAPGFGLSIISRNHAASIWIPEAMSGYAAVRAAVQSWAPFEIRPPRGRFPAGHFAILGFYILYATALMTRTRDVGLILSIAAAVLLAWRAAKIAGPAGFVFRWRSVTVLLILVLAARIAMLLTN